jgi:hypothetical protein
VGSVDKQLASDFWIKNIGKTIHFHIAGRDKQEQ